eukprot:2462475-Amphidinium_carterae.2
MLLSSHIPRDLRCLVPKSATLLSPGCLARMMRFCVIACCSHKVDVSIWRTLPVPRRLPIPAAAVASPNSRDASLTLKSHAMFVIPTSTVAVLTMAHHSDSADDSAIGCCVADTNLIRCLPCMMHEHDVLRLVR